MKTYEIAAFGFDASSDATDDRILWVQAPDSASVEHAIQGMQATFFGTIDGDTDVDFYLPGQVGLLRDRLAESIPPDAVWEGKALLTYLGGPPSSDAAIDNMLRMSMPVSPLDFMESELRSPFDRTFIET